MDGYTFQELAGRAASWKSSLAYIVGLVDAVENPVSDPDFATYTVLYLMTDIEDQPAIRKPSHLLDAQSAFLPSGYFPQTPTMLVRQWSPIEALLKAGFGPLSLKKQQNGAVWGATGIWRPSTVSNAKPIESCESDEELFWAIMDKAFERAKQKNLLVNIIAQPGWSYDSAVGSLRNWSEADIAKADRILWKRTFKDKAPKKNRFFGGIF